MITRKEKIGYGFGDMSSSMFWKIFSYYLPFFYSNVFGLSLGEAGTLLLITKLWDAISDPMMGIIADRTQTRWGKYRPYLLWIAVPFAIVGVLTFSIPPFTGGLKLAYAYVTYILMMTVYTAINVPYGAMLGVMTDDPKQRTIFSSYRMFFAYGGSFLALALFEPIRDFFSNGITAMDPQAVAKLDPAEVADATATGWQAAMIVVSIICVVLFVACFAWTKERVKVQDAAATGGSIGKDLKALATNGPWWILLGVAISVLLFNSIRGGAAAYYFQDFVGSQNLLGQNLLLTCGIFLAVGEIANMVGVVLAVPISKCMGKKNTYALAMVVAAVLSIVFYFIPLSVAGCWTLLFLQIIISVCAGITFPLLWSMYADVADYSEYKNGNGSTGLIFSSNSMAQKFGGAFGSALILWLLAAYGYHTEVGSVQPAEALEGLNALMSWIPALACLSAAAFVLFYPLTEKKMAAITPELERRRNGGAA